MVEQIPTTILEKFTTFGDLLRFLRRRVAMTQMDLALEVGYSDAQISRLEQNLRLPDIPTIEARFGAALGLQDEPQAFARLLELAATVRREDAPAAGLCPYKGMQFFDEADADLFVGREALSALLTKRVIDLLLDRDSSHGRFLAVVGASGSGKSSLVRAGLVPMLRWNKTSADWEIHILTPTAYPLEKLAETLTSDSPSVASTAALIDDLEADTRSLHLFTRRKQNANNQHLLLVIDQFEELFTLCRSEHHRERFIGNLLTAASEPDGPVIVMIALRADFYAHCAGHEHLREALARHQQYIGAMTSVEMRRMIEESAQRGRWDFEPGLVDLLLRDVGDEPGALPLLSHALLETWHRRRGRVMTLSGYASSHGVRGAIAETAETVYADQFTREQQIIARRIFLRLTELGDESNAVDTRRRATFVELILKPEEADDTLAVLSALADARLITTSENSVEVAHEALIREWPTLRGWLEENREELRLHRQLTDAAHEWQISGLRSDLLFRGLRLDQAQAWASAHPYEVNPLERSFLEESRLWTDRDSAEREAQRLRELDAAKKLAEAEHRTARQLRRSARVLAGALLLTLLAAILAGLFANRNSALAIQNAAIAETAQASSAQAMIDFNRSEAQRLAAEARGLMQSVSDPQLIALLSLRSLDVQYTSEGDTALSDAAGLPFPKLVISGQDAGVYSTNFSANGKYILTGSYDGIVRMFSARTGQEIRQFIANQTGRGVKAIFSPDEGIVYAASNDGVVWGWVLSTGEEEFSVRFEDAPIDIQVSSDGNRLLIGSAVGTPKLLNAQTGETICQYVGHTDPVWELAFSPDNSYVATASVDGTARLWQAEDCEPVRTFNGHTDGVASVDFSPDGKILATGSWDKTARLWDVETGNEILGIIGHTCYLVRSVRFSPDGKYLLTGSCDKTARLWDIQTGLELIEFSGQTDQIWSVAFSRDGRYILTGSHDQSVWLWDLQKMFGERAQFIGHTDSIWTVSISPDGRMLATGGPGFNTRLWDVQTGQELYTFDAPDVNSLTFSPDGRYLLVGGLDSVITIWDVQTRALVQRFLYDPKSSTGVMGVAYSPDGRFALTGGEDGHARRWEIESGDLVTTYGAGTDNPGGPDTIYGVAYAPDGQTVLTGGWDGVMRLYDAQSGNPIREFTEAGMGSIYGVAFSPDGQLVLSGSKDNIARVWDVLTGEVVQRLTGHTAYLYAVSFSPDGEFVLTSSADYTARLWDYQTGQELRRYIGHTGSVEWAVFSADGNVIATGSDDGTARLWSVNIQDTIEYLCANMLRDLTEAERERYQITDQSSTCP